MPLPTPEKDEIKNDFISRCMRFMKNEKWKDQKQKLAICFSLWNKKNESITEKIEKFLLI